MSVENEILEELAADAGLISLLVSDGRIMNGNLEKRLPMAPPLLLVEALKGEPEIVGEEGIIVDAWNCTIWIQAEGHASEISEAAGMVMEGLGFESKGTRRLDAGKPEQEWLEMRFTGSRLRQ